MKSTLVYALLDQDQNIVATKTGSFFESRSKAREAKKEADEKKLTSTIVRYEITSTCWEKVR